MWERENLQFFAENACVVMGAFYGPYNGCWEDLIFTMNANFFSLTENSRKKVERFLILGTDIQLRRWNPFKENRNLCPKKQSKNLGYTRWVKSLDELSIMMEIETKPVKKIFFIGKKMLDKRYYDHENKITIKMSTKKNN